MVRRVLVTRPEPDASNTARLLATLGFEALLLPLTKTFGLPEKSEVIGSFDAVAVTSSNALRYASDDLLAKMAGKPCFAVGDKTAKTLRDAGFSRVASANGNAGELASRVIDHTPADARIAYICGVVRRPDFERALIVAGRTVLPIETYDTTRLTPSDSEIEKVLGDRNVQAVLVYSAESAAALSVDLLKRPAPSKLLSNAIFCCLSARVAAALDVEPDRIRIAERPEQVALFDVLKTGG
jgi:uroporphyrinogen-III synthase